MLRQIYHITYVPLVELSKPIFLKYVNTMRLDLKH